MLKSSYIHPPVDINQLSPNDRQLFGKFVHGLLRDNKWMFLEEAQRISYQQVREKSMDEFD
jgi:hypothetical protein